MGCCIYLWDGRNKPSSYRKTHDLKPSDLCLLIPQLVMWSKHFLRVNQYINWSHCILKCCLSILPGFGSLSDVIKTRPDWTNSPLTLRFPLISIFLACAKPSSPQCHSQTHYSSSVSEAWQKTASNHRWNFLNRKLMGCRCSWERHSWMADVNTQQN